MPEENNSGIVSVFIAASVCGSRCGFAHSASTRSDSGASGATAWDRGRQPPHIGTMAAVVAGGVSSEPTLEMGERTVGLAGGRAPAAAIVAGVFFGSAQRSRDGRSVAVDSSSDHDIDRARNLRVG